MFGFIRRLKHLYTLPRVGTNVKTSLYIHAKKPRHHFDSRLKSYVEVSNESRAILRNHLNFYIGSWNAVTDFDETFLSWSWGHKTKQSTLLHPYVCIHYENVLLNYSKITFVKFLKPIHFAEHG